MVLDTPDGGGLRMASETYTIEAVVAAVVADERLDTARDKCSVLASLTEWDYIDAEGYASAGDGVCRLYAFEEYPWTDVAAPPPE
jgi:hypothetical protein